MSYHSSQDEDEMEAERFHREEKHGETDEHDSGAAWRRYEGREMENSLDREDRKKNVEDDSAKGTSNFGQKSDLFWDEDEDEIAGFRYKWKHDRNAGARGGVGTGVEIEVAGSKSSDPSSPTERQVDDDWRKGTEHETTSEEGRHTWKHDREESDHMETEIHDREESDHMETETNIEHIESKPLDPSSPTEKHASSWRMAAKNEPVEVEEHSWKKGGVTETETKIESVESKILEPSSPTEKHGSSWRKTTNYEVEEHSWKNDVGDVVTDAEVKIESKILEPASLTEKRADDWRKADKYKSVGGGQEVWKRGKESVSDEKRSTDIKKVEEKVTNGENQSSHAKVMTTPAAPKKVAQKVNSIIEDYATKITKADDKTSKKGASVRRSDSDANKGHISEMKEKIESAGVSKTPKGTGTEVGVGGKEAGDAGSVSLEEKRKKKAEEWMNKIVKPSADSSVKRAPERSTPLSSQPEKTQSTSNWRKREQELKKEREEKEAAQKQLEEKRKKAEQERRLARETARKEKEQELVTKMDQTPILKSSTDERKQTPLNRDVEKFSRSVQSPSTKSSPLLKSFSITSEDEKTKKQKVLDSRLKPLNIEGLTADGLERIVHELHDRIRILEEEKYDLEILLEKRDSELNELKVRTGDTKGKFIKPPLKKLIKTEEVSLRNKSNGELSFRDKLKAAESGEYRAKTVTNEERVLVGIGSDRPRVELYRQNLVEFDADDS